MRCHIPSKRSRKPSGFTLIELLTVIAIIGILAAILVPTVSKVRATAKKAQCVAVLRQWGNAVSLFANNNRSFVALSTNNNDALYAPYFNGKALSLDNQNGGQVAFSIQEAMCKCPSGVNGTSR